MVQIKSSNSSGLLSSWKIVFFFAVLLFVAVPATVYWCTLGTVVISYPPGSQIFINGLRLPTCSSIGGVNPVQQPQVQKVVSYLNTFWFTSPVVIDLDMDRTCTANCNEIVVCDSICRVFNSSGSSINNVTPPSNARIYAGPVVHDIDNNGKMDLCVGYAKLAMCWEWNTGTKTFSGKSGWPVSTAASGENRGMAAEDFDKNGQFTIFISSSNDQPQTWAFLPNGTTRPGWPRWNNLTGAPTCVNCDGNPGRNGNGTKQRYGSYGLNIGIGNMDDDIYAEVTSSFDDHQIAAWKRDGNSINSGSAFKWYGGCGAPFNGNPITWGAVSPRFTNATTDDLRQMNQSCGSPCFPNPLSPTDSCGAYTPCVAGGDEWMQFTQSPTHVMDIDNDGQAEFISLPTSEKGGTSGLTPPCTGYIARYRSLFVLNGAYGNGGDPTSIATVSGLRKTGFNVGFPPNGGQLACYACQNQSCDTASTCIVNTYYPPQSVPAVAFGNVVGSADPEMIFAYDDGRIVCYSGPTETWAFSFESDLGFNRQTFYIGATEPLIADLNGDGLPEVVFVTYGAPVSSRQSQWLYVLNGQNGNKLWRVSMNDNTTNPVNSSNGNGYGMCGTPTIADINGDGTLEIVTHTFDGRMIIFTVPGSSSNCLLWNTGRGGYLRKGQPDVYLQ